MRTARKGDRCEFKIISTDNLNGETCEERHMEMGINIKGPVSLIPCKQGLAVRLLCQKHAPAFPNTPTKRLRRKPEAANGVQENLL